MLCMLQLLHSEIRFLCRNLKTEEWKILQGISPLFRAAGVRFFKKSPCPNLIYSVGKLLKKIAEFIYLKNKCLKMWSSRIFSSEVICQLRSGLVIMPMESNPNISTVQLSRAHSSLWTKEILKVSIDPEVYH